MNDKTIIGNIALAKELLGEDSNSFKIIEKEPELFEIMFPGVLEYVNNPNEQIKKDFIEAIVLMSNPDSDLSQSRLEKSFTNFIYPVRVLKDKLKIS